MWTLARAKPGMMSVAMANLDRQSFNSYAPRIHESRIIRHRSVIVIKYLFSTYIFIEVIDRWMALSNTYGLSRVFCNDGKPERVPDHIIADLREREVNGIYQPLKRTFVSGQRLYARGGLLQGKFGVCEGMKGPDRVKVLFAGLAIDMPLDDLEAA